MTSNTYDKNINEVYLSNETQTNMSKKIYSIYGDLGKKYFSKYGGSVTISAVVVLMIVGTLMYINVKNNLIYIKENWNDLKCDPRYAPFAGMIIQDKSKGFFEAGTENANYCFNSILREVGDEAMIPYNAIMNVYSQLNQKIITLNNDIRDLINNMRNNLKDTFIEQYGRLMNTIIPIQKMLITIRDIMAKMKGAMVTSMFPMFGVYLTLKSALDGVYNLIVKILIGMAATIAVLWIFPFTWGAAASMTAVFAMIMVPMIILSTMMGEIFHLSPKGLPKKPKRRHCFNGDFIVHTQRGDIPIKDLFPGDSINNITITSVMKLCANEETMYDLKGNGLYVSGNHKIFNPHKNIFIDVCEDGRFVPDYSFKDKYVYCFNTSSKIIRLGGHVFLDYDELNNNELNKIINESKTLYPTLPFKKSNIHKIFDGGFYPTTRIRIKDGNKKSILSIQIGDELGTGNRVIGKVFINNEIGVYNIRIDNKCTLKGVNSNIILYDKNDNKTSTLCYKKTFFEKNNQLAYNIHLLTTKGYFYIENSVALIKVGDYNSCIEYFIEK